MLPTNQEPKVVTEKSGKFSCRRVLVMVLRELPDEIPTQLWDPRRAPSNPLIPNYRDVLHTPGRELRVGAQRSH